MVLYHQDHKIKAVFQEVTKFFFGVAVLIGILITELLRESDLDVYIAISFASFGVFAFGMYPLGLELAVEVTYPVDESFSTALIFMSGVSLFSFTMEEGSRT